MTRAVRSVLPAAIAAIVALLASGCGDGRVPRYKVSGKVTYKGQPVPKGTVTFSPADAAGEGAFGAIVDGSYSLTTHDTGDGAVPAKYLVAITSAEAISPEAALDTNQTATPEAAIAKSQRAAKHFLPTKYNTAETSGLTVEVKAESNTFDFPLTD